MDQYIEQGFKLQSEKVYGLGERYTEELEIGEGNWTLWANPEFKGIDEGHTGGFSYSSQHPFLMTKLQNGNWMGIYWFNSNAQQVNIFKNKDDIDFPISVNFITVGGVIDLFFFQGNSA